MATPDAVARAVERFGLETVLSPAERLAHGVLFAERRRRDWLAGRLAAKRAARRALRELGLPVPRFAAVTVASGSDGAPSIRIEGRPELTGTLSVSIAHDRGTGVAAVTPCATWGVVGIDLERDRALSYRHLRPALSPREWRRLADADAASDPPPLAVWAMKEAVLKALRLGGAIPPCDVELRWVNPGRAWAHVLDADTSAPPILARWRRWRGHILALARLRAPGGR